MGPILSENIKEILEQMANLVSEWFFRHRFITRHHIRKSSMRICFILPKQVNSNVYYFFSSVKEKFF